MEEITFQVHLCEQSGLLIAAWTGPLGLGGITTQGKDLRDLQETVMEAVRCHFDPEELPKRIRIHFSSDAILLAA